MAIYLYGNLRSFWMKFYSQAILLTSVLKIIYLTKGVGIQAIKSCETSYL